MKKIKNYKKKLLGLAAVSALAFNLATPTIVSAQVVTIGSNLSDPANATACGPSHCTMALFQYNGQQMTAPCSGTITQWSVRGYTTNGATHNSVELQVIAAAGGGTYSAARASAAQILNATDSVHTAATSLPISQGNYIAIWGEYTNTYTISVWHNGSMLEWWDPGLATGGAASAPTGDLGTYEPLVSAQIACNQTLTVARNTPSGGSATSNDGAINCGGACSHAYASGTAVTLTASPAAGYGFSGWSGACSGTGVCSVTVNNDMAVTANFQAVASSSGGSSSSGKPGSPVSSKSSSSTGGSNSASGASAASSTHPASSSNATSSTKAAVPSSINGLSAKPNSAASTQDHWSLTKSVVSGGTMLLFAGLLLAFHYHPMRWHHHQDGGNNTPPPDLPVVSR